MTKQKFAAEFFKSLNECRDNQVLCDVCLRVKAFNPDKATVVDPKICSVPRKIGYYALTDLHYDIACRVLWTSALRVTGSTPNIESSPGLMLPLLNPSFCDIYPPDRSIHKESPFLGFSADDS
uniref:Uncharacterized protein n=1 Tax=Steinernema glaseri TaxID=37863 RepID=A0A1I7Y4G5_9BILA